MCAIHWTHWRVHRKNCVGFFRWNFVRIRVCGTEKPQINQLVDLLTVKKWWMKKPTTARVAWKKEATVEIMWVCIHWNFHPKAILRPSQWTELTPKEKKTVIAVWYSLQIQCKFVVAFPTSNLLIITRNCFGFPMILPIKWSKTKAKIKKNEEKWRKKLRIDIQLVDWSKFFFHKLEQ